MLSFPEWLAHWGEPRLDEIKEGSQKSNASRWQERNNPARLWSYPAWELRLGSYWEESLEEWHTRWNDCGGRLSDGRMIAAKWDGIWGRLSSTFYDGLTQPYPPYARSSCAFWADVDKDEAIVVGAISESDYEDYMAQFPREPLLDKDGNPIPAELIRGALKELEEEIYRAGGPPPGASREERVAHEKKRREDSFARSRAEYENRNREKDDQNSTFRLMEQVEESLRTLPTERDDRRWEWLCASLGALTTTLHFDRYPKWRARAWVACAELHRINADTDNEVSCLEQALSINGKLPIKKRIKELRK